MLAAFVALLATAMPAAAAQSCGRKVIDDWWDGRIDGTYELHCYDDAIEILPRDVRDYSSAEDDIKRALANARRGKPAPPNRDTGGGAQPSPASPDEPDPGETTDEGGAVSPPDDPGNGGPEVAGPVDTESASSVPIPLLILAGLALLLVAGGSAGYVIRRIQARRAPPSAA